MWTLNAKDIIFMEFLNCDPSEIQSLIMDLMSCKFPKENLDNNLTIEYLNTRLKMEQSLNTNIKKSLLIRRTIGNNTFVTIVFLDKNNKPISSANTMMGVEIKAPSIDVGILNIFSNKSSIVCLI